MIPAHSRRLFVITAFFVVMLDVAVPLIWLPPGWVALASGLIGSIVLLIPPMRIEVAKAARSRSHRLGDMHSPAFAESKDQNEAALTRQIEEEREWDAYFLVLGGILYFVWQIPYKLELVSRKDLQQELLQFQLQHVDPLNKRIQQIRPSQ